MRPLLKVTAFVITASTPHHLLVFKHPMAGLQLPAGTVEPGEHPVAAASREVNEETGVELTDSGVILDEKSRRLTSDRAVLIEAVEDNGHRFRRGHTVSVVNCENRNELVEICDEVYDYSTTPPELISSCRGLVPRASLASTLRRTFVLYVEPTASQTRKWTRHADGHEFEVFWTLLRPDIPLFECQKMWLQSHLEDIERHLNPQTEK